MRGIFLCALCCVLVLSGCRSQTELEKEQDKVLEQTVQSRTEQPKETAPPEITPPQLTQAPKPQFSVSGKVIVVDAGHGKSASNRKEAIAPNSSETKAAFVSGTRGKNQTEEELNLAVAKKLKASLEEMGAVVHMTRTDHTTQMSNIDRAEFGNSLNADLSVKLHADGVENTAAHGVSVLVPGGKYIEDAELIAKSRQAAECILAAFVQETGANDRGISVRNDMTGFNWSKIPVVLVEMGFMTNPQEDRLMETDAYQNKMAAGIAAGVEDYFSKKTT